MQGGYYAEFTSRILEGLPVCGGSVEPRKGDWLRLPAEEPNKAID